MAKKPLELRPVYHYTIVRDGRVLGRFKASEIKKRLGSGSLLKTDQFKHPFSGKWTILVFFERVASSFKRKLGYRPRRGGAEVKSKPIRNILPHSFDMKAKFHVCVTCHNCSSTAYLLSRKAICCTDCGGVELLPSSKRIFEDDVNVFKRAQRLQLQVNGYDTETLDSNWLYDFYKWRSSLD